MQRATRTARGASLAAARMHERAVSAERDSSQMEVQARAAEREADNLRRLSDVQVAQAAHLASQAEAAGRRDEELERRSGYQVDQATQLANHAAAATRRVEELEPGLLCVAAGNILWPRLSKAPQ